MAQPGLQFDGNAMCTLEPTHSRRQGCWTGLSIVNYQGAVRDTTLRNEAIWQQHHALSGQAHISECPHSQSEYLGLSHTGLGVSVGLKLANKDPSYAVSWIRIATSSIRGSYDVLSTKFFLQSASRKYAAFR